MSPVIQGREKPREIDPITVAVRESIGQTRRVETVLMGAITQLTDSSRPADVSGIIVALGTLVSKLEEIEKAQVKRHREIVELLNKKTTIEIKSSRQNAPTYTAEIRHG